VQPINGNYREELLFVRTNLGINSYTYLFARFLNFRPEYTKCKSHEYRETDEVLVAKVKLLAELIKKSKNCIAYTGAGLSVASGLDDYATKAKESLDSRPHVSDERGSGK
jgi:hypothetical protein